VTQISLGIDNIVLESQHRVQPYIELLEARSLTNGHRELVPQHAANVCKGAYDLERTGAWVSQCEWVCDDPAPCTASTTWLVSCKSDSE
jgi:hypothetical protein